MTVAHQDGPANLQFLQLLVNSPLSGGGGCYLMYDRGSNSVILAYPDPASGSGWLVPGSPQTAYNARCTLYASGSSASSSGSTLTVRWQVTFSSAVLGTHNLWTLACDYAGACANGGWSDSGDYTVGVNSAPTYVSLTPLNGSGSAQAFTLTMYDANGIDDFQYLQLLINANFSGADGCYLLYDRPSNKVGLAYQTSGDWMTPGIGATSSNAQCTLHAAQSSVSSSNGALAVTWYVSFGSGFTGGKNVWVLGGDRSGVQAGGGWQLKTSYTVTGCTYAISPTSQSFTSAGGSGTVNVTAGGGCGWTAASNASWITVTAGGSGSGNGNVSHYVAANSGSSRAGTMTIAGQTFTVTQDSGMTITTASPLPNGTVSTAYSQTLAATGGTTPYTWSLYSGQLPAGLSLSSGGMLSGTPATSGTSNFTVQVSGGGTATKSFGMTVSSSASNDSACLQIARPQYAVINQQFRSVVTFQNTGTTTWSGSGYALVASDSVWGTTTVPISSTVGAGQSIAVNFLATAPAAAVENRTFSWRMSYNGVPFGATCQNTITVRDLSLEPGRSPLDRPSILEVNLGPIPLDKYFDLNCADPASCQSDPTRRYIPTCDSGFKVSECFENALKGYKKQGVQGVRFQFGICGGAYSEALTGCRLYAPGEAEGSGISVSSAWVARLRAFLQEIRTADITWVTPTPAFHGFGGDKGAIWRDVDEGCYTALSLGVTLPWGDPPSTPLEFWPAAPYAVLAPNDPEKPRCSHSFGVGGPYRFERNLSYNEGPSNQKNFVGWSNLFAVFTQVLQAMKATTPTALQLREFDISNEIDLPTFPAYGRLIYDNGGRFPDNVPRNVDVLQSIRNLVPQGFDPNLVTYSVYTNETNIPENDCLSVYGDSARVLPLSELISAIRGGLFGQPVNPTYQGFLTCLGEYGVEDPERVMPRTIAPHDPPAIADVHYTPNCPGLCQDPETGTENEAKKTFSGIRDFLHSFCPDGWRVEKIPSLCNALFMLGEVAVKKVPPVSNINEYGLLTNCDGSNPAGPDGAVAGFNESTLSDGVRTAVIRPWTDNMNPPPREPRTSICYELPHNLRRTYSPQQ